MTSGISESPAVGVGKMLQDSIFIVPTHQRDYSWTETNVRQLFDDVEAAREKEPVYFLGLMVFLSSASGEFIVLDGQQRLATAVIVFSALRSWLRRYSVHQDQARKLQDWFIGRSELGETEFKPRLKMNIANDEYFNEYIIKSVPKADIKRAMSGLKKEDQNRDLLSAALYAHDRVEQMALDAGSPDVAAQQFFKIALYLRDNVRVVRLIVTSEEAAFTIFETLNDRGQELSPLDLVKNHLFRSAKALSAEKLLEMERRWLQMVQTLSNVKANNFLKAFWTSRHGRIRTVGLFENFKREYSDKQKALTVSVEMLAAAEKYAALESSEDPVWAPFSKDARQTVRSLRLLGSQPAHPVILAALTKWPVLEIERLLRLIEVLIVRYSLIAGGNTGRFETSCAVLARLIWTGEVISATQAFGHFKDLYPQDADFQYSFSIKSESNNQKVQYILRNLEKEERLQQLGSQAEELEPGALTVEHIFPKNPSKEWSDIVAEDPAIIEDCIYRLGNVCLLGNVNQDLGNISFERKKSTYASAQLLLTKNLGSIERWNRKMIEHQQAKLAKLAVQTWRFQ